MVDVEQQQQQSEQSSADKPRSSKNDDFHGFALYKFKARRPNNGDTQKKQNDDEKVDGGVSSKGASEETGEDSVADFLRKEATTNNDFSLSLLSTNLSGEQETELRTFMAKRLTRGPLYSGSGHISTLDEFFPDQSAICYYCLLRGGKETGEFKEDNKSQQMDSLEYGSYLSKDYVICLVSGGKSGLDLFQKELDEYSKGLLPSIDRYSESQDVQESFKHLEEWYDENVKFVCRCTSMLKEDLASIIQLGLLGGKLQVDNEDTRMQKDFKMFVDACSTANVLDSLNGTKKDTEDLAECFAIIPMEIVLKTDGIVCSLSNKVTTRFCREWTKTMMSGEVDNPVFLRQVIENYKLRVNHDMNTLRRLLRQAEMDHYALYRSYVFLLKSGNGPILLRNTTLEAHALASEDTLSIIKALEEYIEENKQFGIEALSE